MKRTFKQPIEPAGDYSLLSHGMRTFETVYILDAMMLADKGQPSDEFISRLNEVVDQVEVWYVLKFGRTLPTVPTAEDGMAAISEFRTLGHVLSNVEAALLFGLAHKEQCAIMALAAIQQLRQLRERYCKRTAMHTAASSF